MRVLIVDDSRAIRSRLAALLSDVPGVEIDEAASADEAMARARAVIPHAVLLDLHMPGPRGGIDIIVDLKRLSPPPRVIVVTSQVTTHHERTCLALGADAFLDKATEFNRVVAALVRPTDGEERPT